MKNRFSINLWIDLCLFLSIAAVSISGFVINYVMPPCIAHRHGVDGLIRYNRLTRHYWGDIHTILGVVLLTLLLLHILLHREAIGAFFAKRVPSKPLRIALYLFLGLILMATIIPWIFAHYLYI